MGTLARGLGGIGLVVVLAFNLVQEAQSDDALQGFEELGLLAGGLSYAHIHTSIAPQKVRTELENDKQKFVSSTQSLIDILPSENRSHVAHKQTVETWRNRTSKDLDEIINRAMIWEEIFKPETSVDKRQALVFALGLMGGLTSGFGFSLYSQTKITHLQELAYANTDAILQLVEATDVAFNKTRENEEKLHSQIQQVFNSVKNIERQFKVEEYTRTLSSIVEEIVTSYQNWETGIVGLLQGRASPFLFRPSSLKEQLEILSRRVGEAQHELLHSPLAELYRFEVSMLATADSVKIFVHIPIVSCGVLKVYKLQDTPFFDDKEDVIYKFHTETNVLAINEDHSRSIALSLADINRCRQVTSMYYCDHDLVMNRKPELSCVGAIFVGNKEMIRSRCAVNVERIGDAMQVVNRTAVRIFSTKGKVRVHNTCSSQQGMVSSGTVINLAPGCNIFSEDHWFGSTGDVSSAKEVVTSIVTLDKEILPLKAHEKGRVKRTLRELQSEGETTVTFQKIRRRLSEVAKEDVSHRSSMFSGMIAVAAILIVIGLVCYLVALGSGCQSPCQWYTNRRGREGARDEVSYVRANNEDAIELAADV